MPAKEFLRWQYYFTYVVPFTRDREEYGIAKLCYVIANTAGRRLRSSIPLDNFIPDFMKDRTKPDKPFIMKSIEQQNAEWAAWIKRVEKVAPKAVKHVEKIN